MEWKGIFIVIPYIHVFRDSDSGEQTAGSRQPTPHAFHQKSALQILHSFSSFWTIIDGMYYVFIRRVCLVRGFVLKNLQRAVGPR